MVGGRMGIVFDLAWRHKATSGLTWRLAVESDIPRIHDLWTAMEGKLGKQDKPDLFEVPVVLTLVAEDEAGVIVSAIYGEAVVDWTGIGTDRRAADSLSELFPVLHSFLFDRGIRVTRVLVPRRLAKGMRDVLPWMTDISHKFAQFAYTVRL
jgi:hypothetical protein